MILERKWMRFNQYITEKRTNNVIIVDIQPEYSGYIRFMDKFTSFLNNQRRILCFYNGSDVGSNDKEIDIIEYFIDNGLDENKAYKDIKYIEKGYGFFRGWMDGGVDPGTIKKAIRFMVSKKVNDSRDISREEWTKKLGDIWSYASYDDPIYLPDIRINELKRWSGSYLCGGGKDECLKEIQILFSVFNIKYILVKEFIY